MVTLSSLRQQVETQQGTSGLDSAQVSAIAGSGVSVFETLDSLPSTGLTAGDEAFVKSNSRLYVSNGDGWYNTTLVNRTPRWDSGGEPDASYTIVDSATPLIITARAIDSDNGNLLNQAFASDSAQYMVDISSDSSVFTFTPKSADSIGIEVGAGNLTDSNGDFIYTFKWSDGVSFVSKAVTIGYSPSGGGAPAEGTFYGNRGIYFSGYAAAGGSTVIDYWDMVTASNATKFGDLDVGYRYYAGGAASNNSRALYMGGSGDGTDYSDTYAGYGTNKISYITCSTPANALDFGDLSQHSRIAGNAVEGDGTYAVSAGGGSLASNNQASTDYSRSQMEDVTIATTGNSSAMGSLTTARENGSALSNGTRMVVGGGMFMAHSSAGYTNMYITHNRIDYFVVANFGSASDFGDLTNDKTQLAGAGTGSGDRGLFMGGLNYIPGYAGNSYPSSTYSEQIQYITVSTPSNATDFGDLRGGFAGSQASGDAYTHGCCNGTNAQFVGGYTYRSGSAAYLAEIQNVVMDTLGNATLHGDLTVARYGGGATSGGSA